MNKTEFLDMLRDYLLKYYSNEETLEILRDYEEYFINGKLDGKTEEEIVNSLGSPKKIVSELVDVEVVENKGIFDKGKEKFFSWYENKFYKKVEKKREKAEKKSGKGDKSDLIAYIFKNILLIGIHFFVFIIFVLLISTLISMVMATVGGVMLAVFLTPVTTMGLNYISMSVLWVIFPILLAIGLFIIMSILIFYFTKFTYKFILEYINWVKIQMMYKKYEKIETNVKVGEENEI